MLPTDRKFLFLVLFALLPLQACESDELPVYGYRVVNVFPHDENAFTQGLFFRDGWLYESTGRRGASSIRKVHIDTGRVGQQYDFERRYFGEGIVDWEDRLIAVTWEAGQGFVFGIDEFDERERFNYAGEGWGLTRNDTHIIMSDGTPVLRFLDPDTLETEETLTVMLNGEPLQYLNELEWIDGEIYSNVWTTNVIVRIDPDSGNVTSVIDLAGLLPSTDRRPGHTDVLNGIAYDAARDRLFVTGKNWPKLFEIDLVERSRENQ
jgi:glutaminyl-peptide cyclotransferase